MKLENAIILILIILIVLAAGFYTLITFGNLTISSNDDNSTNDTADPNSNLSVDTSSGDVNTDSQSSQGGESSSSSSSSQSSGSSYSDSGGSSSSSSSSESFLPGQAPGTESNGDFD
ncbi:MAG: hypothetical protein IJ104_02675 [Methanobrevibacter sp.]|nr:hypothetical protein [Methanobrevibacter sp.]